MTSSKKSQFVIPTTIEDIPKEIIVKVLARVAADSFTDIFNVKLSCKHFSEIAEDEVVYRNVSLDKFSVVQWEPLNEKQQAFLKRCLECQNPELLYKQAVVDYFNKGLLESTYINLEKAVKLGHIGALYVTCIIHLFNDDIKLRNEGTKLLGCLTKSEIRSCRENLINMLKIMWVNHPHSNRRPICCTKKGKAKICCGGEIQSTTCEACIADNELGFIFDYLQMP